MTSRSLVGRLGKYQMMEQKRHLLLERDYRSADLLYTGKIFSSSFCFNCHRIHTSACEPFIRLKETRKSYPKVFDLKTDKVRV